MPNPRPVLALAAVVCAACAEGGSVDAPPRPVLEDLRIGSVDDPATALTSVPAVLPGPNGSIYIAQPQDMTIRVFDRAGAPVRSIGRNGGGPGEFGSVGSMGWLGDTLWVSDFRNMRVSFFGPDGEPRGELSFRNAPPPDDPVMSPSVPTTLLSDGTALMSYGVPSESIRQGEVTAVPVVRIERTGVVLDTIHMRPLTDDQLSISHGAGRNMGTLYTRQPWSRSPYLAVSPDGLYLYIIDRMPEQGGAPTYGVMRVEINGDTLWSERFGYVPVEIDEARRDSALDVLTERLEAFRERSGMSVLDLRALLDEAMTTPAHVPPVSGARVGGDGTLWLHLAHADGSVWQRISPEGANAGRVAVPAGVSILAVRGDTLWGTVLDDLDVSYVVRMILIPGES